MDQLCSQKGKCTDTTDEGISHNIVVLVIVLILTERGSN